MVTEADRIKAIPELMAWRQQDDTVKMLVKHILLANSQPSIGHLARLCPDDFDILYEEASALVRNPW